MSRREEIEARGNKQFAFILNGLAMNSVVGQAIEAAAQKLVEDPADQLPLFDLPSSSRSAEAPIEGALARAAQAALDVRRGPGRPPGATNKSTRQLREWLLAKGVHPLISLMRWSMHTPESLAAELGCSKLEAFDRLKAVWAELAPYFIPKMQPVGEDGQAVPFLQFVVGGVDGGVTGGRPPWEYLTAGMAEIRHSEVQPGASSDGRASDEEPNPLTDKG